MDRLAESGGRVACHVHQHIDAEVEENLGANSLGHRGATILLVQNAS